MLCTRPMFYNRLLDQSAANVENEQKLRNWVPFARRGRESLVILVSFSSKRLLQIMVQLGWCIKWKSGGTLPSSAHAKAFSRIIYPMSH